MLFSIADLKAYFVSIASDSTSKPITRKSVNIVAHEEQEQELEGRAEISTSTDTEQVEHSVEEIGRASCRERVYVLV